MVLYLPNFSLVFLIHVFLYAGVYCTVINEIEVGLRKSLLLICAGIDQTLLLSCLWNWQFLFWWEFEISKGRKVTRDSVVT